MPGLLARNRQKINEELRSPHDRRFFTAAFFGANKTTVPAIENYARGKMIDVGCGDLPYKEIIVKHVDRYDTFDIEKRVPEVMFVGDIQNMEEIADESYDSALCLEVLEHVPHPFDGFSELGRILKKDGVLIMSVPHLSRLHEEPWDFYRYTKYALKSILEERGFEIVEITSRGGLFSFLGHQFSTVFVCLFWHIPVIKHIVFFLNKWLCVKPCRWLDRHLDKKGMFALGYTVVAKKK